MTLQRQLRKIHGALFEPYGIYDRRRDGDSQTLLSTCHCLEILVFSRTATGQSNCLKYAREPVMGGPQFLK